MKYDRSEATADPLCLGPARKRRRSGRLRIRRRHGSLLARPPCDSRLRAGQSRLVQHGIGQGPIGTRRRACRGALDHRERFLLARVDVCRARNIGHNARPQLVCQTLNQCALIGHVAPVQHQASEARVVARLEPLKGLRDVRSRIHRHHLARRDHVHHVGALAAQRQREAAAHHISQHVVQHDIRRELLVGVQRGKLLERRDDTAPRASRSRCRPARLHAQHACETAVHGVLERGVRRLPHEVEHRGNALAVHEHVRGVSLRIAPDLHDRVPPQRQHGRQVGHRRRLPDAAFSVHRDSQHRVPSLPRALPCEIPSHSCLLLILEVR